MTDRSTMAARWVAAALVLRVGLDGLWAVSVGPRSLMQVLTPLIALLLVPAAAGFPRKYLPGMALLLGLLAVAVLRCPPEGATAIEALRLGLVVLVGAASLGLRVSDAGTVRTAVVAALGTMGALSLAAAATSSWAWVDLTDVPRLRGVYMNVHNLALAMGFGVGLSAWEARDGGRWALVPMMLCGVALYLSYTRSAWIFAAVGFLPLLRDPGHRKWALLVVLGTVALIVADPVAQTRATVFAERLSGATDPLELGTGRLRMWTGSLSAFAERPVSDWLFGGGLRAHEVFWKPKHPASEWLYVLYQFGVAGVLAAGVLLGTALRQAWRRDRHLAVIVGGVVVVGAITDGVLVRVSPSWLSAWLLGLALMPADS